jgi:hypothetical protein
MELPIAGPPTMTHMYVCTAQKMYIYIFFGFDSTNFIQPKEDLQIDIGGVKEKIPYSTLEQKFDAQYPNSSDHRNRPNPFVGVFNSVVA